VLIINFFCVQALEDFVWQSSDLLDRLEDLREDLNHNDFADDVPGAKKGSFFSRDPNPYAWAPIHWSCWIRIPMLGSLSIGAAGSGSLFI
jgi:hypothetical protein